VDILAHSAEAVETPNKPTVPAEFTEGVARWLEETAGKTQGDTKAVLQQQLASVRNLQARFDDSAALYRQAITTNSRDALAMNNLAFLRSTKDQQHDEALALVERARGVMGPHPELLDTEALIRLEKREAEAAIKLLEVVVAEAPSGTAYFHLARAYDMAKNESEARRAWRRAGDLGLKSADLHPLEQKGFADMETKFGKLK
jgi:tetratricopeptide (TPR) repeat protein